MMKLIVDENLLSFKVLEQKVCDKCSLPVPLDSGNSVEKLCDSWVQTRGYLALRILHAHTLTRLLNGSGARGSGNL